MLSQSGRQKAADLGSYGGQDGLENNYGSNGQNNKYQQYMSSQNGTKSMTSVGRTMGSAADEFDDLYHKGMKNN